MKIIAGKFKNRNIEFVSNETTRPTANLVREALFSKIQFNLEGSVFLDLFSGSGSVGIEALSRGAKKVYFVEKNRKNAEMIKRNLENCKAEKSSYEVLSCDFAVALNKIVETVDFVYLDPPYKSDFYTKACALLIENNLITNESLVICEHEAKQPLSLENFSLVTTKKYGIKALSYFTLNTETQPLPNSY